MNADSTDEAIEQLEVMNRLLFGDPYRDNPRWRPLWAGPGECPYHLRVRTGKEIRAAEKRIQ